MYFGATSIYQVVIFIFLVCFVDISKAFTYPDKPLVGPELLTSFAEILLAFAIQRDFFINTVLYCTDNSLKFALTYRFAACLVDLLGIVMVGSYSTALLQSMQDLVSPEDGLADTVVDFLVADSDFALVFLFLVANNLVQFSLYILFTQLDMQHNPDREQDKTSKRDMAILIAAQLRSGNFAQFKAALKEQEDQMSCSVCLVEF